MKTYSITYPSLQGFISRDDIYFEGTSRPSQILSLRDGGIEDITVIEKYFDDIHKLFLRKMNDFVISNSSRDEDTLKMQALLQELIKVKRLIENASKVAIMKE